MNHQSRLPEALGTPIGLLWDKLLVYTERYLSISAVFYRLLVATFTGPLCFRLILGEMAKQVYFTAIRGVHILIFAALMLGLHMIMYATVQLVKVSYEEFVGWLLVTIVVRELGPVLAGVFILVHSGGPIVVEIGTMSVSREIEALQVMGIDPYRYLGVPRLWGVTISVIFLYILIVIFAVLGGCLFAQFYADIYWWSIWHFFIDALQGADLITGLIKVAVFGMIVATVSIYAGFGAHGDMGQVSKNTAQAALWGLVLCGGMDILITNAYYLFPHPGSLLPLSGLPPTFLCSSIAWC